MALFWRLFLANSAVILLGGALIAFTPMTVSYPITPTELAVLALVLFGLILCNAAILGEGLSPLVTLRKAIDEIQVAESQQVEVAGLDAFAAVSSSFNAMIARLNAERRSSARAALRAQEQERAHLARDLHDEIGQNLTFLLLRIRTLGERAPVGIKAELESLADATRITLDEVRHLSRHLGPSVLSDLGVKAALASLVADTRQLSRLEVTLVAEDLPRAEERDLALYRITQEALTNVVKHSRATSVAVRLNRVGDHVVLTIADDGTGRAGIEGTGSYSMRERASLAGGTFERESIPGTGTTIRVVVPLGTDAELDPPTRPLPGTTVFPPPEWAKSRGEVLRVDAES